MSDLIVLGSAKASPGVSTLAVLLARAWPGPSFVVEADPAGGDLAEYLGLAGEPNLSSLAIAARSAAGGVDVMAHAQLLAGYSATARPVVVVGPHGLREGQAIASAWPALASGLTALGEATVLVDVGRIGASNYAWAALGHLAKVVVLVTRSDMAALAHLPSLLATLTPHQGLQVVSVGDRPYTPVEVAKFLGVPVAGCVPWGRSDVSLALTGRRLAPRELRRAIEALAVSLAQMTGPPAPSAETPWPSLVTPRPEPAAQAGRVLGGRTA